MSTSWRSYREKDSRGGGLPLHRRDIHDGPRISRRTAAAPRTRHRPRSSPSPHIQEGQSSRRGFNPWKFLKINFRSASYVSCIVNVFWPVVPAAIAVRYAKSDVHLIIFILSYIAMIPCANMIGFAGQELARKVPHVYGVLTEVTLGSVVEIVMFQVLLSRGEFVVIKAAILGSILATLLLCMGIVFFVGGLRHEEQSFDEAISEAGSGLLLVAGLGLTVPTAFEHSLEGSENVTTEELEASTLDISRFTAVLLLIAYGVFAFFQARTHHGIYDSIFRGDEHRNRDKVKDAFKEKLTLTECIVALAISITLVTILAITLVDQIPYIVEDHGISEPFMGLILVPLVEKAAEHLTAVDEAWDNQMNFAMSHVLGATLQTAMFTGPLVVIVGWGLDKNMDLSFEVFEIVVLILSILVMGNFLRDQKSNYLEGFLCVIVYIAIAVAAFYYPNPTGEGTAHVETDSSGGEHR
ncbi:hypothetical protein MKZ38_001001 [Zalerion maritima]|uniref:Vacuolar calcium ion transporter n=1 Tax=Zalerion maritima TaxID=339359 RepID=A0AAD5WLT5_9PEZI|nr:hypothetical protein MKZ38_001001 [Zalerion maritima]